MLNRTKRCAFLCFMIIALIIGPARANDQAALDQIRASLESAEAALRLGQNPNLPSIRRDIASLGSIIDNWRQNDLAILQQSRFLRASLGSILIAAARLNGQPTDIALARSALADFDNIIADGRNNPAWADWVANVRYLAGSLAYSSLSSPPLAYAYWAACAQGNHAGCLNIMADSHITGEGGQRLDPREAMSLHERVYNTGTSFICAGAFSALSIAQISHLYRVNSPGAGTLEWLRRSQVLLERLAAERVPGGAERCGPANFYITEFLIRLDRGEQRPDLLQRAAQRAASPEVSPDLRAILEAAIHYMQGRADEQHVDAMARSTTLEGRQCTLRFQILWYAKSASRMSVAQRQFFALQRIGRPYCSRNLAFAARLGF